ncbi:MAG: sigma-70 family RNA polymerase sigma factor [bacterium]|nr:sigma-70 family RNA polymerase sigma factor [bacterium]
MSSADRQNPNLVDFRIMKDKSRSEEERLAAFERLLGHREGWLGDATLMEFAHGYARFCTQQHLRSFKRPDVVDADDIASEAVWLFFKQAHKIEHEDSLPAFIKGVIRNLIRRAVHEDFHTLNAQQAPDNLPSPEVPDSEPAPSPRAREMKQHIESAISSLSPALQDVARMYMAGASQREIAIKLGISPNNARQRVFRCRNALRRLLEPYVEK